MSLVEIVLYVATLLCLIVVCGFRLMDVNFLCLIVICVFWLVWKVLDEQ
nr:MAG TPA: hypothetical protein [Caudoviricetes sp.]